MPFVKGQISNPLGRRTEKPFADALRLAIADAGPNQRALRKIATNLVRLAQKPTLQALPAIIALADRLDGRPSQESMVTHIKRDASDWSRDELVAFLRDVAPQIEEQQHDEHQIELKAIEAKTEEKS